MKKMNILAITGVVALTVGLLSFPGANAEESSKGNNENSSKSSNNSESNNSSQEFRGSSIRSHGHPIANLTDAPTAGSKQDQKSYVNNDDENSEVEWQKWNKANAKATAKALGSAAANPIIYHAGGPLNVYSGAVQIIPVWVGNWNETRKATWNTILGTLVSSLAGGRIDTSNHIFKTNLGYFPTNAPTLSWPVTASASVAATGTVKAGLVQVSDANVATYINNAIKNKVITAGSKPIYVYIGANNTRLSSGFGTAYCGWHSIGTIGVKNIPYIAIQDFTSTYTRSCSAQTISPNGDVPLDAVASILVHEIDEALTDPDLRTWYDSRGAENADKCAWAFGTANVLGSGAKWNFAAGSPALKYYIQMNWLADNLVTDAVTGSACVVTK
jgi:hypothetical protein